MTAGQPRCGVPRIEDCVCSAFLMSADLRVCDAAEVEQRSKRLHRCGECVLLLQLRVSGESDVSVLVGMRRKKRSDGLSYLNTLRSVIQSLFTIRSRTGDACSPIFQGLWPIE